MASARWARSSTQLPTASPAYLPASNAQALPQTVRDALQANTLQAEAAAHALPTASAAQMGQSAPGASKVSWLTTVVHA